MATESRSETVTLRLEQQISGAADAATGSLGRLERQIAREQNSLGRLEQSIVAAKAKLSQLAQAQPNAKAVAAFQRQSLVVDELREKMGRLAATGDPAASKVASRLADASAKMERLRGGAESKSVDAAAYRKQEQAVAALTDRLGAQKDKIGLLRDKMSEAKTGSTQMGEASKMVGQRLGVTSNQTAMLVKELAALGLYGAIAAASILVTVGAIAALVSVVAKGISAAGQMRSELLKLQTASVTSSMGMHWLFNSTRETSDGAARLQKNIDRVSASSSLGREKLAGYAAQIQGARFYGEKAEKVLRAMSIAGSAGSEAMAQDVLQMSRAYRFAGGSIDDLAKRVEQKLGRAAMSQAIALDAQMRRLGENITWIFGGADIDPLLRAINSVLSLFNAGSKSATSMRDMVTLMVEKSIGGMLRLGIAVLKAYIAVRSNETAWKYLTIAAKVAGIGLGLVVAATLWVALAATAATAALIAIPVAMQAVKTAIVGGVIYALTQWYQLMWGVASTVYDLASSVIPRMGEIGSQMMTGLANGIMSGAVRVWNALKSVVGIGVKNTENQLEVKSPSRVYGRIGGHAMGGMAGGIRSNERMVVGAAQHVTASMVHASRASVANDFRVGSTVAPQIAASVQMPWMGMDRGRSQSAPQSAGKSVTFTNCNFGSVPESTFKRWVLEAMEEGELEARTGT